MYIVASERRSPGRASTSKAYEPPGPMGEGAEAPWGVVKESAWRMPVMPCRAAVSAAGLPSSAMPSMPAEAAAPSSKNETALVWTAAVPGESGTVTPVSGSKKAAPGAASPSSAMASIQAGAAWPSAKASTASVWTAQAPGLSGTATVLPSGSASVPPVETFSMRTVNAVSPSCESVTRMTSARSG